MPTMVYSFEHKAFIKECSKKRHACPGIFVGGGTWDHSYEILREFFHTNNYHGYGDGLQSQCMQCVASLSPGIMFPKSIWDILRESAFLKGLSLYIAAPI